MKTKNVLKWLGTILTLLLFIYLIQKQDWQSIRATFKSVSIIILIIVWVLFFTRIVINSLRWFILLKIAKIEIPYIESMKLFFLGVFISNFLPSTIGGDGVRFLALLNYEDDKSLALSSIIVDRLVNVAAMLFLLPITIYIFYGKLTSKLDVNSISLGLFLTVRGKFSSWENNVKRWICKNMFWIQSPKELFSSIVVSWVALFLYFYGIWLIATELDMAINLFQVTGITILTYLITLLPISINGYGVREVAITSLYTLLGYPQEAAISLAIITRLIYLSTTLIGAVWLPENLLYLGKRLPNIG